ncbi:leucyl/phenylalanyl-tRNA--protein transferase [Proteobacteria bacterium 005FR1]|nr:leucyl/phenylalanyl-tRNA--protein transferase [Proteobacteria bacterium 005FR1]
MIRLPWLLPDDLEFPPPDQALDDPNGLLAAGGDLSPPRLLAAYRQGIFPWYEDGQPILWWSPDPRTILLPRDVHISRSLRKVLRRGEFMVTADQAFEQVILACAGPRDYAAGTWITDEMAEAYCTLHRLGYAHSIETWRDDVLVGGMYGVAIGRAFFGESMFSHVSNASKVALVHLAGQLAQWDYGLIDCQVETGHLLSMGAINISRAAFQGLLLNYTAAEDEENYSPRRWSLTVTPADFLGSNRD